MSPPLQPFHHTYPFEINITITDITSHAEGPLRSAVQVSYYCHDYASLTAHHILTFEIENYHRHHSPRPPRDEPTQSRLRMKASQDRVIVAEEGILRPLTNVVVRG